MTAYDRFYCHLEILAFDLLIHIINQPKYIVSNQMKEFINTNKNLVEGSVTLAWCQKSL